MTEFVRPCVVSVRKLYLLRDVKAGRRPKWGDIHALDELIAIGLVTQNPDRLTPAGEALLARAEIEAADET